MAGPVHASHNIPTDYTQFLNPNGLKGARLGLTRLGLIGFDPFVPTPQPVLAAFEAAINALTRCGRDGHRPGCRGIHVSQRRLGPW